ncbi:hypothetical protein EO98_00995 [Methanosarcina sp. 2.H.T.1A.6]|uniref:hypothetical protein n=1 Tax=unclassified Methanosarcina TaxID=2644672 RepID=UPI00062208F8|nr:MULTISPECIES: hypothetical protein [unclassified Methanosarcina]KKG13902.1 hypothetical protein EO94_19460 [Methanosarcina sp. 2.H.T.1A.3]KKG17810.1 hypothetical protein EO97_20420 [Methanosarcina sp. 2.H.T.1A.15]KKG21646.1 hypothetical protein EO96_03700 [Methanosarcina sp. 2.H.T.1A.8]KKG25093.1 hypothetical protein EO98_00995 [Methanosarcina sp. 2.H.T.1A.6]
MPPANTAFRTPRMRNSRTQTSRGQKPLDCVECGWARFGKPAAALAKKSRGLPYLAALFS